MNDLSRQSFLGSESGEAISAVIVGVIGLCGGGSHVAQQLAHIGIGTIELVDHDHADDTNINRMIGLTAQDVIDKAPKTEVIKRLVQSINPDATANVHPMRWQDCADTLRECTAIFGCVDSFKEREQLERFCRRFMIPYIDVGMDVHGQDGAYFLTGQVILSLPGHACMRCMGFLTEKILQEEAKRYGDAGGKPQVVWPNGTLASVAVGQFMAMLTPWNRDLLPSLYLDYDGNRSIVTPNKRLPHIDQSHCPHFCGEEALGDPTW